jgi:hypothetical protein
MKTRQKENEKKRLRLSKRLIVSLNHVEIRGLVGGNKTSTIPTCVSNEPNCFFRITK